MVLLDQSALLCDLFYADQLVIIFHEFISIVVFFTYIFLHNFYLFYCQSIFDIIVPNYVFNSLLLTIQLIFCWSLFFLFNFVSLPYLYDFHVFFIDD